MRFGRSFRIIPPRKIDRREHGGTCYFSFPIPEYDAINSNLRIPPNNPTMDQPPPPLPHHHHPAGYAPAPHMAPFPGEAEPWNAYHTGAEAPTVSFVPLCA